MSAAARNVTLEVCSHCGDVAGAAAHGHSDAPDWRWLRVEYAPVEALRAAADAEAEAGDEARREATRLRAENTRIEGKVARLSADVNRLTTKGVEVAAENTRLREALDGIVEDLSVPSRPVPWVSHALKLAQDALKVEQPEEAG